MKIDKDIKQQIISEYEGKRRIDFVQALNSINLDSIITKKTSSAFSKSFGKEDAYTYMNDPIRYEKELRNMSKVLCSISPQYKRLVSYFPTIAKIIPVLIPNNSKIVEGGTDKLKKAYQSAYTYLDVMNLKHEFVKVLHTVFVEGIFYGVEYESKQSYYIKKLNPDYCRISSIEDGCLCFQFDFAYFDSDKTGELVKSYPSEFKSKYNKYLKNKKDNKWQEISSDISICIKYDEDLDSNMPPFANVFADLYDINDYKELHKANTEMNNYKLIGLQIPMKEDSDNVDDFQLDGNTIVSYYQNLLNALPVGVGAFLSPMPFKEINFAKQTTQIDNINNSVKGYWDGAGVSSILFGSEATSGSTLGLSIKTDESLLFPIYRQLERWLNKKAKSKMKNFKIQLLDVTYFNQKEVIDKYMTASQYGLPVKTYLCAAIGMMPNDIDKMTTLENDLLKLQETWIPLSSSHTQSGSSDGGRPEKSDTEVSESGEVSRDNDSNSSDNRL